MILEIGEDREAHKNEELANQDTIEMEEKVLRDVFRSLGLTDKEGNFPISEFLDKIEKIYSKDILNDEKIKEVLNLTQETYGYTFDNQETMMGILTTALDIEKLKLERCVIKRVFEKEDKEKTPVVYAYLEKEDGQQDFYYVDVDTKSFIKMTQEQFEEKFECYELDLERDNGVRPWEEGYGKIEKNENREKVVATKEKDSEEER